MFSMAQVYQTGLAGVTPTQEEMQKSDVEQRRPSILAKINMNPSESLCGSSESSDCSID